MVFKMVSFHALPMVMLLSVAQSLVQIHPQNMTLINGYSGVFHCEGEVNDFLLWNDIVKGPPALFSGVVGSNNIARGGDAGTGTKYENFFIDSPVNTVIFNMSIRNAQFMDDEGLYSCATASQVADPASLSIEVPTDKISLSCDSCDGTSQPTCECTCVAEGGHPESLTLRWGIDQGSIVSDELRKTERNGKYDFNGTASVRITQNEAVLQCSVQEYVNQADIENDFSDQVIQEQMLSSPTDCMLTLVEAMASPSGDCTVQLNCLCHGLPPVNTCTFYNGTEDTVIPDKDSCVINHPVPLGTEVTFLCSGSNGINFQKDISDSVAYECRESTTTPTLSPTSTDTTTSRQIDINSTSTPDNATTPAAMSTKETPTPSHPDGEGLSVVAIIFISLGGVAAVAAVGGGVYFVFFREPSNSSKGNNSVRDGESDIVPANNEETNSSAPLYGVVNKDKKKKSDDNTDGNGVNSTNSDQTYAAVNKPLKTAEPKAAPRSSAPSAGEEPEKMELQYADIDHGNKGPSFEIHQPADAPTEYATVQSVIV